MNPRKGNFHLKPAPLNTSCTEGGSPPTPWTGRLSSSDTANAHAALQANVALQRRSEAAFVLSCKMSGQTVTVPRLEHSKTEPSRLTIVPPLRQPTPRILLDLRHQTTAGRLARPEPPHFCQLLFILQCHPGAVGRPMLCRSRTALLATTEAHLQ